MEENIKNKKDETKFLLKLSFCFVLLLIIFLLPNLSFAAEEDKFCYLSDVAYDAEQSSVGWGSITLDKNLDSSKNKGLITLIVDDDNTQKSFFKGISAHATSTLVYDISNLGYDYFSTYYGVDASRGNNGNGVKFSIYTSTDGENWDLHTLVSPPVKKGNTKAEFITIDIKGKKYLKLYAHNNGNNDSDHAVYANAKLYKEGYVESENATSNLIKTVAQYDEIIKGYAGQEITGDYEKTLLQREFVNDVGYDTLQFLIGYKQIYKEIIEWLLNDTENLRQYTIGNPPDGGNYYDSLTILARLYEEYSDDFENTELLGNPTYPEMTYGDLYKKMAMSIALTHTQRVGLWMNSSLVENQSEPLRRYAIFKYLHKNGGMRISEAMDMTHLFEDLHVAEMRLVLYNNIDDEEILWLNRYTQDNIDANPNNVWRYQTPHPYIAYVWPNYANPVYFENEEYFNELFAVKKTDNNVGTELLDEDGNATGKIGIFDSEFVIPGGKNVTEYRIKVTKPKTTVTTEEGTTEKKTYKLWMNFRNKFGTGCVCGGISKSGANIRGSHGIPAMVVGQPGHAALMFYSKDAEGRGFWRIDNDVSGWTLSGGGGRLLGWGSGSYAYGFSNGVYVELEQAAVNDYENLIKAEELVFLAKVYKDDLAKQEELYENALTIQSINFDAWLGLIDVYKANVSETEGDGGKTEDDFYNLAERIAEKLKYYPLPMYNATNLIKPNLTKPENTYKFTLLQSRTLTEARWISLKDTTIVVQPGVTVTEANYLLGKVDQTIATFSFDGVDAGKIVLSSRFDGNGVRWDYSLTGKDGPWIEVDFTAEEEHKLQLTKEQIASITAENDIYVHIVGVNYDEKNLYKIDILDNVIGENILYGNDLENRVIGVDLSYEWRNSENDAWTSYATSSPNNTGNKTLQVRQAAAGTKLASNILTFTFTEDNQLDTRKYIRIANLSIEGYSTQSKDNKRPYYAPNAIDGNLYTLWHTDFAINVLQQETKPFITIKLDKPRYISALEFIQRKYPGKQNDPDDIKNAKVFISQDGQNWTDAGKIEECPTYGELYDITFSESVYGQYVKLEMETKNIFSSLAMVNLFEDKTKIEDTDPIVEILYNTQETTNQPVYARLVNSGAKITITNNNGSDTYVFTENGEFEFEYVTESGDTGSITAVVSWIDKTPPTADITYGLNDDKKLFVLLDNISKDVYLLDEDNNKINYIEVDEETKKITNLTYLGGDGSAYKILDKDASGNTTKITYKNTVKTEDSTENVKKVETYITTLTDKGEVTSEEYFDVDGNAITDLTDAEKEEIRALQQTARSNPLERALETSGEYEFKLVDKSGNLLYKSIKVDYIDNDTKIIASDITYNITKATNTDVVATINPYIIDTEGKHTNVEIVSEGGATHTFTKNESFTFEYKDSSDTEGIDIKIHTAKVDWIDKTAPTAEVKYSTTESTDKAVTVTLINESEEITIINNGANREYTFLENGEFIFRFTDKAGNVGTVTAKVDWILEDTTVTSDKYKVRAEYISRIDEETTVKEFKENVKSDVELVITDKDGNVLTETDKIKTGMILKAGEEKQYTLIVRGDIDRDGFVTVSDLLKMKIFIVEIETPLTYEKIAADLNEDGTIEVSDLLKLKMMIVGL